MGMVIKNRKSGSRGQSLVETAIIIPVVLLLVLGIIDFGLIFNNYILITNASREGARKASIGGTDSEVIQVIQNMTTSINLSDMTINITPSYSTRSHGAQVKVKITYRARLITPIISKLFPDGVAALQSESIMRVE